MNDIILTENQQSVFDNILSCIHDAVNDNEYCTRIVVLNGPAGSGKTTTSSKLIDNILGKYKLTVCCTTHKALGVLRDMLKLPDSIQTKTIHSHLNLKMKADLNTGIHTLVVDKLKNPIRTDVLFVDESSMVSNDLFEYITDIINKRLVKIVVFVGDKYQLLPIESSGQNPIYVEKFQYNLTEVVRQAADNPIIQLATEIRKCIESKNFLDIYELKSLLKSFHDNDRIIITSSRNDFFSHYFNPENEDKHKFICTFTNKAMTSYNNLCRGKLKGFDIPAYIPGDEVVFNEMHSIGDLIQHVNNEIVTISFCSLKEHYEIPDIWYWECKDFSGKSFNILDSNSSFKWNKYLSDKAKEAKSEKDKSLRSDLWREFFNLKEYFQNVSFTYAGTVHKAQGSSFDYTYIDADEILSAWKYSDNELIYRLLYVAITRPKEKVVILLS